VYDRNVLRRVVAVAWVLSWVFASGTRAGESLAERPGLSGTFSPGQILSGETKHRLIHFTFDDGPDTRTTPQLLAALDRLGIKATFFFSASKFRGHGERPERLRQLAREVATRGHSIGSHSTDHVRMRTMPEAQLLAQLAESDRLFSEIFGRRTFLFRPPWGSHSSALDALLATRGDTLVLWNLGMADWVQRPAAELAASFLRRMDRAELESGQRGGVVLMHDTHPWSIEALPLIVESLRKRNCALLPKGEELYDIVDDLSPWRGSASAELAPRQAALRVHTQAACSP
jgi:peptidoglycan/xylan/chitin deacetylase (PgdA/CDA1 family)